MPAIAPFREPGSPGLDLDPGNQATELVDLARVHFELFSSPDGRAWAVEMDGPNIAIPLGRKGKFAKRLARKYVEAHRKAPGDQAVSDAVRIITAFLDDEDPRDVFLRVARYESSIVLDLGRADGQCVIVTKDGWRLEGKSQVPFRRGKMTPLPVPDSGDGTGLQKLRKLLNVDEAGFRLAIACLVAYLIPGIPYPILVIRGEQGTAKTTFVKILMRCIDPGRDPGTLPRDERNFAVRMWNGHVHGFDNLRDLAPYQSDMLCRAATGDDYGERTLYFDDEMTSLPYRRPIILNGIDLGMVSPDLADREVPIELVKISEAKRRSERTVIGDDDGDDPGVLDEFDAGHADILAALLDILTDVLKYLPQVGKIPLPRMADFGKVLAAMDLRHKEIHGKQHSKPLLDIYRKLAREAVAESGKDDVLGNAILELLAAKGSFEGTTAELFAALVATLPKPAPDKLPRGWPANPRALGHRFAKLNPALRANGLEIIRGGHGERGSLIYIQPCPQFGEKTSGSSGSSADGSQQGKLPDDDPDDIADDVGAPDVPTDNPGSGAPNVRGNVSRVSAGRDGFSDIPDVLTFSPQQNGSGTAECTRCGEAHERYGDNGRPCLAAAAGHRRATTGLAP